MDTSNKKEKTKKIKVEFECAVIETPTHYKILLPNFNKINKLKKETIPEINE